MDLSSVERELRAARAGLEARLARAHDHLTRSEGPLAQDFAEQAVERENDEVVQALHDRLAADIAALDTALQRVAQGTYGVCTVCGEEIAAGRLKAMPAAAKCTACAERG
jgi:RNA polymerase-binding transcription factor DksA